MKLHTRQPSQVKTSNLEKNARPPRPFPESTEMRRMNLQHICYSSENFFVANFFAARATASFQFGGALSALLANILRLHNYFTILSSYLSNFWI